MRDVVEEANCYMNLFADDPKLLIRVKKKEDGEMLQNDLDNIAQWSHKWEEEETKRKRTGKNYRMK